ncbi:MAG: F0F1 ATP synthase subunit B [Cytophagales bacterium]|nr:F0F1 ATP synthase subunit B [Cytophagales bacterium]
MELVTPNLGLIVWTTIIFLSLLFLLSRFAWSPIVKALEEREHFIEDALNAAQKAKEDMENLKADNEKLLYEARVERDKMLKDAALVASNTISEAKDKAAVEAGKMIENARLQIQNEKNAAITELKNLVASASVDIAEKILKKQLTSDESQNILIEEYLKESKLN